ncbi:hypothetical protein BGZ65_006283 [Modicella reniformis]|uniref:F-box domain-containing protein n=1 Tax=Modicella reniformis TaxID=1440133 RepID=A0A9P6IN89_9FUNG|nr:hypothetical protein BGZ65_006283 [Modicella reniformis]
MRRSTRLVEKAAASTISLATTEAAEAAETAKGVSSSVKGSSKRQTKIGTEPVAKVDAKAKAKAKTKAKAKANTSTKTKQAVVPARKRKLASDDDDDDDDGVEVKHEPDMTVHKRGKAAPKERSHAKKKQKISTRTGEDDLASVEGLMIESETPLTPESAATAATATQKEKKTRAVRKKKQTTDSVLEAGSEAGDTQVASKPKRNRTISTKRKGKMTDSQNTEDSHPNDITRLSLPVNRTDPCAVLPTEVWHQILSLLPLSKVTGLSLVSKTWLDGTRAFPAWKIICETHKLGMPKLKYRSYMALVCSRSFWICDKCHSYTTGRGNVSEIPLKVANEDDDEFTWLLCHACRLNYYRRYPEEVRDDEEEEWQRKKITKTNAQSIYHLSDDQLSGLYYDERRNPYYRSGYPMRLYNRHAVQKRALRIHAGWVGIDASTEGIARKRSAAFRLREEGFKRKNAKASSRKRKTGQQQQEQTTTEGQSQDESQGESQSQSQGQSESQGQSQSQSEGQSESQGQSQTTGENQQQQEGLWIKTEDQAQTLVQAPLQEVVVND